MLKARQGVELLTSGELRVVDEDGAEEYLDGLLEERYAATASA